VNRNPEKRHPKMHQQTHGDNDQNLGHIDGNTKTNLGGPKKIVHNQQAKMLGNDRETSGWGNNPGKTKGEGVGKKSVECEKNKPKGRKGLHNHRKYQGPRTNRRADHQSWWKTVKMG